MTEVPRRRFRLCSKGALKRLIVLGILIVMALGWGYLSMIRMPGRSFAGPLPTLTTPQAELAAELRRDVVMLAETIGKRNFLNPKGLQQAETFLEQELNNAGYTAQRQTFDTLGTPVCNIEAELLGSTKPDEILVIGAHYDSVDDCPAANDNGSGVAGTLAIARRLISTGFKPDRTIRFVLFVNEEPPNFQTELMGSLVYAKRCQQRGENIVGMISLETIGYYSDAPNSQQYPIAPIGWLYPDQGNFLAFVGNFGSRALVRQSIESFRKQAQFPSEGAALPGFITGVDWSDHWGFWQAGYPALMVTDTAIFRYPHYHLNSDTPDKLDYDRTARVAEGLQAVVKELAGGR